MSKKREDVVVTGKGTSFNSHTCKLVGDGKDGGRIEVVFDNQRRLRNTMHVINTGGARGIDLDSAEAYFQKEYHESYTRSDVKYGCDRLVKLGFVSRIGPRKNPTYRLTKAAYERFKAAKKIAK